MLVAETDAVSALAIIVGILTVVQVVTHLKDRQTRKLKEERDIERERANRLEQTVHELERRPDVARIHEAMIKHDERAEARNKAVVSAIEAQTSTLRALTAKIERTPNA